MSEQSTIRERRWGARSVVSLLVFVIAALVLVPALIGHWGHRTVVDSERYIATVGPLIEQPEVQDALATSVTDAVVAKLDTQNLVQSFLGNIVPNDQISTTLAGPVSAGINGLIGELITQFIKSPEFASVWIELNKAAQKGLLMVLEGEPGGPVSLQGDQIVLDTSAALQAIQAHLVDSGLSIAGSITVPDTDRQVVLLTSPGLAQIRTIYSLTAPILEYLPLVVAILFGIAIGLARRRARTVVATGIVLIAGAVAVLIAINVGEQTFVDQLASTPFAAASQVFYTTLLDYLVGGTQAIVALGIVLVLAGWFGGRTSYAVKARTAVVSGLADLSGRMTGGKPGPLPENSLQWVRWVIYALGMLILLVSSLLAVSTVLWISALVAGLIALAQLLSSGPAASAAPAVDTAVVVDQVES